MSEKDIPLDSAINYCDRRSKRQEHLELLKSNCDKKCIGKRNDIELDMNR